MTRFKKFDPRKNDLSKPSISKQLGYTMKKILLIELFFVINNLFNTHKKLQLYTFLNHQLFTKISDNFLISLILMTISVPTFAVTYPSAVQKNLAPQATTQLSDEDLANAIGWVNQSMPNQICQGYYSEPNLYYEEDYTGPANDGPIHISADNSELTQTGQSTLSGTVKITQPNRSIQADLVHLNRDASTEKISSVDTYGNVILREPGNLMIGNKAHFNLFDKSGSIDNAIYRMAFGSPPVNTDPSQTNLTLNTLNGWGTAKEVKRLPSGIIKVYKGSYSACPPTTGGWQLTSNTLTLNRETGRGQATNAVLSVDDVPILYVPYFNFPIDHRRQSGFLYPSFGSSTQTGYDLAIPYYFNLAPNYDLTITPDIMGDRGLQLNALFRYLTEKGTGNFHASFLPDDRAFSSFQRQSVPEILGTDEPPSSLQLAELNRLYNDSDNRYFVSLKDSHTLSDSWSSYVYLNKVSDDYYFENFKADPAQITQNQIINDANIYYNSAHWHFSGETQWYQTLHPVNQSPVENQYKKLPELVLSANYPELSHHINLNMTSQYDDFLINNNPGDDTKTVDGQRFYFFPDVNMSQYTTWGFFKPDLQLALRQYDLNNQVPNEASSITSALPIADIDAGLFFDRQGTLFSHAYRQTFEPRLFYLYVPYQNQNDIPLFDTSIDPFSFAQLFQINRFTGFDRVGDANQLSLAATTRFISQASGDEKARLSIGQIYYFQPRKVNIENEPLDLITIDNEVPPNSSSSPIAGEFDYHVNQYWQFIANAAWNPSYNQMNNANTLFQYKLDDRHILNLGYNFLRGGDAFLPSYGTIIASNSAKNNLNQTDFSLVWPVSKSWSFVGRWNYNISHEYPQTYFSGLQYDACCWSFRVVAGREFNYLDNNNRPVFDNRVYGQIALKTLGNVGSNKTSSLVANIPGYVDHFGVVETAQTE